MHTHLHIEKCIGNKGPFCFFPQIHYPFFPSPNQWQYIDLMCPNLSSNVFAHLCISTNNILYFFVCLKSLHKCCCVIQQVAWQFFETALICICWWLFFFLFLLLFICAYKARFISPPCSHPLPYHPLLPLPLPPTPSIPSRNYFALISNFVVERV
jgi:hypothetical protein